MRHLLATVLLLFSIGCQGNQQANEVIQKSGTPKYKAGNLIVLQLGGKDGQVLSVDCYGNDPCKYHVRYLEADDKLAEGDYYEFELRPRPAPSPSTSPSVAPSR